LGKFCTLCVVETYPIKNVFAITVGAVGSLGRMNAAWATCRINRATAMGMGMGMGRGGR